MTPTVSRLSFLLDAPAGSVPSRIQIAKLGSFSDPARYGDFTISADDVADWARNLAKLPGGVALIDEDHLADKSGPARRTEASGWITSVGLDDGVPMGDVEWTPKGRSAIEEGRYRFFSPVYGPYTDESGVTTPNVLHGGALTNKPFLSMGPVVSLSREPEASALLLEHELDVATRELQAAQAAGGETGRELARFLRALDMKMGRPPRSLPEAPAAAASSASGAGARRRVRGPLDVPFDELVADRAALDRMVRALCAEAKCDYITALDRLEWGQRRGADLRVTVGAGGVDVAAVERRVRAMEASAAEVRQLASAAASTPARTNAAGQVLLGPEADRGRLLTDPAAFENDLMRVQAQGLYALNGDRDREMFRADRASAIRNGVDLPATIERQVAQQRAEAAARDAWASAQMGPVPASAADFAARYGLVPRDGRA